MALVKRKTALSVEPGAPGQERDCNDLAAALGSDDAVVRRQAARELAHCQDAGRPLVTRLVREEDHAVREIILNTLVRLNDPAAISSLVDCLRSEDAALRNEVIEAFKQMGSEVSRILESLLADPDPDVRIFAVNILDSEQHPEVESWLINVIEADAHVNVCATAVDLLCEVGTEAAVDPLIQLKARFQSEPYIQFAANLALKRIRGV